MDFEKLIGDAAKDKANRLEVELPSFESVWEKAQSHNNYSSEKKQKKRNFAVSEWLQIAVVLLIITVLPVAMTKLRSSSSSQITPSGKQEASITQAEVEEARKVANGFLTGFYTVEDYKSVDEYSLLFPNDPRTQRLRAYTTDVYFTGQLAADSNYTLYLLSVAKWTSTNFYVGDVNLSKYAEDAKNKSIVFTSEVVLNCKLKDGTEKSASFRGQIIIEYAKDGWKVGNYTETSCEPKEMFDKSAISKNFVGVNRIVSEFLPHPFNPVIYPDALEFKGKWKGNVMPEFEAQMMKLGWELYDGMGTKKFYKKEIDGKEIKISVLPREQGGPEEKNASTIISVNVEEY